jgi:hypothetical protein
VVAEAAQNSNFVNFFVGIRGSGDGRVEQWLRWSGQALHGWNLAGLRRDRQLKGVPVAEISARQQPERDIGRALVWLAKVNIPSSAFEIYSRL